MKIILLLVLILHTLGVKHQQYSDEGGDTLFVALQTGANSRSQASEALKDLQLSDLGQMFVDFAQVELQASGAVDTLIEVMKAFGRQLEDRMQQESEIYDARLAEHTSKVLQLDSLVNQAELDINREKKRLNQELIPRSAELDDILISLRAKKEGNTDSVNQAKMTRKDQNGAFNQAANEISEAIRAVDEALEQIKAMMNKSSGQSLLQLSQEDEAVISKRLHTIMVRAEKVGKFFGSFLEAISQLTEGQNFSDKQVIKQLVDLLNSLRGNFVETLQKAYADEDQQKLLHDQRIAQLAKELDVFDKQYGEAVQEREEKSIRISDTQNVVQTRQTELKNYEDRLTIENNNFSMNQKIHDDLVASINSQIGVIEKSIDTLVSPVMQDVLQVAIGKSK